MTTKTPHIYLFHGTNTWSIRQKTKTWIEVFNKKYGNASSIDIDVSSNAATNLLPLIQNTLSSHTLFSSTSLLRIRGLFSKSCPAAVRDLLIEKLPLCSPTTFVIIEDETIDKRLAIYKLLLSLQKSGTVTIEEFELPTHEKLQTWILSYLKGYGVSIEPIALTLLMEQFDTTGSFENEPDSGMLWHLSSELHKLVHYTGRKTIHHDDVELLVCAPDTAHIFNLIDAILAKQKTKAYTLAHDLVSAAPSQTKSSVVGITSMLRVQFRALLMVKSMKQAHIDDATMAKQLGWNPKRVWVVSKKTSSLTLEQLQRMYRHLLSFEEYIKLNSTPADAGLDILIAQLLG